MTIDKTMHMLSSVAVAVLLLAGAASAASLPAPVVSPSARKSAGFVFSARNVKDRKIDVATFVFSGI